MVSSEEFGEVVIDTVAKEYEWAIVILQRAFGATNVELFVKDYGQYIGATIKLPGGGQIANFSNGDDWELNAVPRDQAEKLLREWIQRVKVKQN